MAKGKLQQESTRMKKKTLFSTTFFIIIILVCVCVCVVGVSVRPCGTIFHHPLRVSLSLAELWTVLFSMVSCARHQHQITTMYVGVFARPILAIAWSRCREYSSAHRWTSGAPFGTSIHDTCVTVCDRSNTQPRIAFNATIVVVVVVVIGHRQRVVVGFGCTNGLRSAVVWCVRSIASKLTVRVHHEVYVWQRHSDTAIATVWTEKRQKEEMIYRWRAR